MAHTARYLRISSLNESPYEKVGKFMQSLHALDLAHASMKVPTKK